ncbi:MAG: DUF6148 family protein [Desulfobulbaceae bacterium]|jgi:hypothetical protein|nr:DUF6148 family protein [Desulfobulbaceae bacterium]
MNAPTTYKGYTLSEAKSELANWKAALTAASTGKEYVIGSRRLARYDLREIRRTVAEFAAIIEVLSGNPSSPVKVYARKSRW